MIVGNIEHTAYYQLTADFRALSRFTVPHEVLVPKLRAWVTGTGTGTGDQSARGVIYDDDGALVGYTEDVVVTDGQVAGWVDFPFLLGTQPEVGLRLAAGSYYMGLHGGAASGTIEIGGQPLRWNRSVEPSMESGAALTWHNDSDANVTSNSIARSQVWAARGLQSLYIKQTKDANTTSRTFLVRTTVGASAMPATAGNTYSAVVSANVLDNLVTGVALRFSWYNGATPISSSTGTLQTGNGLKTLTLSAVAPANTTNFAIGVYGTSTTSGDVLEMYLDAICPEEAAAATYFDGDQTGYLWLGAAGYSGSATGRVDSDAFVGGPAATIGTSSIACPRLAVYAAAYAPYAPLPTVPDRLIAELPVPAATSYFGSATGPDESSAERAICGWHGTRFAEEQGAYAIVKLDGPLSGYVGERVKIEHDDRVTYAYVYDERDILEDISLTRRAFMDLSEPTAEELDVIVTAMGAGA